MAGFKNPPFRADRNRFGGGLIAYVRSDLPCRRRHDIEKVFIDQIESIAIEITIKGENGFLSDSIKRPELKTYPWYKALRMLLIPIRLISKAFIFLGTVILTYSKTSHILKIFLMFMACPA